MVHLSPKHLAIILDILSKYPYKFYVFGSRTKGTHHPLSDLDLGYFEDIPLNTLGHLEVDFAESDLPFKVDIINLKTTDPQFQKLIQPDLQPLPTR